MSKDFTVLRALVMDGIELQFGKLTICDLHHYCGFRGPRRWQVFYCDSDERKSFYHIYRELDAAVYKFLELKNKIGSRVR